MLKYEYLFEILQRPISHQIDKVPICNLYRYIIYVNCLFCNFISYISYAPLSQRILYYIVYTTNNNVEALRK